MSDVWCEQIILLMNFAPSQSLYWTHMILYFPTVCARGTHLQVRNMLIGLQPFKETILHETLILVKALNHPLWLCGFLFPLYFCFWLKKTDCRDKFFPSVRWKKQFDEANIYAKQFICQTDMFKLACIFIIKHLTLRFHDGYLHQLISAEQDNCCWNKLFTQLPSRTLSWGHCASKDWLLHLLPKTVKIDFNIGCVFGRRWTTPSYFSRTHITHSTEFV